jgi:hypothetical protein
MAYQINKISNERFYTGLKTDTKPTNADPGAKLYEIDLDNSTVKTYITHNGSTWTDVSDDNTNINISSATIALPIDLQYHQLTDVEALPVKVTTGNNIIAGTATGGTTATLVDTTKNLEMNSLNGKIIKIITSTKEYIRLITSSIFDTVGFIDTEPAIPASVTVTGSTGGSMVINCKVAGALGNDYSVILVAGTGISQIGTVTFADNLLTITSSTDGSGNPEQIMPGNVEGIIDNDPTLSALFDVGDYQAGLPLDILAEAVPFTGGSDGDPIIAGTKYYVYEIAPDSLTVGIDQTTPGTTNKVVAELTVKNTQLLAPATITWDGTDTVNYVEVPVCNSDKIKLYVNNQSDKELTITFDDEVTDGVYASWYGGDNNVVSATIPASTARTIGPYQGWPKFLGGRIVLTAGAVPTAAGTTVVEVREV